MHRASIPRLALATSITAALLSGGCKKNDAEPTAAPATPAADSDAATEAASAAAAPADAGITARRIDRPFLWRVRAATGESTGYLFGTMHLGVNAEEQLPKFVWDHFDEADLFAMEADLTDTSVAQKMLRQDGSTLSDQLGEETWSELETIVGPMMAGGLDRMKPASAATMVAMKPLPKTPAMDLTFLHKAKQAEMELVYLEEVEFQLDLLERFVTVDVLRQMVRDYDEIATLSRKALEAYVDGDAEAMQEFLMDPAHWEQMPDKAQEALLTDRNERWVPKIEKLLARGTPFVAVGAGHLVGEGSVIELLRAEGYEIDRIAAE